MKILCQTILSKENGKKKIANDETWGSVFLKFMEDSVRAQQIEFKNGCKRKFNCYECSREVKTIKTESQQYGTFAVFPGLCNECRKQHRDKMEADAKFQEFILRQSKCSGYQNRQVKHVGIFPRWKDLRDHKNQAQFIDLIQSILDGKHNSGFIFGSTGTGKTYLAKMLANELYELNKDFAFIKAVDLTLILRKETMGDSYREVLAQWSSVPILIIDDFGTQKNTDFTREFMFSIIDKRYEARLTTVITTNLVIDDIEKDDRRLSSRLLDKDWMRQIKIVGADLRA